jgi:hypothetical protein
VVDDGWMVSFSHADAIAPRQCGIYASATLLDELPSRHPRSRIRLDSAACRPSAVLPIAGYFRDIRTVDAYHNARRVAGGTS